MGHVDRLYCPGIPSFQTKYTPTLLMSALYFPSARRRLLTSGSSWTPPPSIPKTRPVNGPSHVLPHTSAHLTSVWWLVYADGVHNKCSIHSPLPIISHPMLPAGRFPPLLRATREEEGNKLTLLRQSQTIRAYAASWGRKPFKRLPVKEKLNGIALPACACERQKESFSQIGCIYFTWTPDEEPVFRGLTIFLSQWFNQVFFFVNICEGQELHETPGFYERKCLTHQKPMMNRNVHRPQREGFYVVSSCFI